MVSSNSNSSNRDSRLADDRSSPCPDAAACRGCDFKLIRAEISLPPSFPEPARLAEDAALLLVTAVVPFNHGKVRTIFAVQAYSSLGAFCDELR